jgi:hypothetical protein
MSQSWREPEVRSCRATRLDEPTKSFTLFLPMSSSAPSSPQAEPAPAESAGARALLERQLGVLGRLAEAGLNVALAIEQQATAAAAEAPNAAGSPPSAEPGRVVQGDVALAYARAARAVRLTVALQAKLLKDLQALDEADARRRRGEQAEVERARQAQEDARKERVERIVERVILAEFGDEEDADEAERLAEAAFERLDHDEIYGDLTAQPIGEIIARVCRDLGLSPDWSQLAEEAWAREEIDSGAAGSPFLALSWPDGPGRPAADPHEASP